MTSDTNEAEETHVKKLLLTTAAAVLMATSAQATTIGVTMALFDDNFLTVLRSSMIDYAKSVNGVTLQIEDAQNDISKQQNEIENFIASGVDAIIVNTVDTDATLAMSKLAAEAGVPLVFVNRQPVNLSALPANQAFVGSDEAQAGSLEAGEVCKRLGGKGNVVIMMGELQTQSARVRTQAAEETLAKPGCSDIKVVEKQTAKYMRPEGINLMSNWLSAGVKFNGVISNNDEMALGAIQAMKSAGLPMKNFVVAGVDGTQDALATIASGDMAATVFQNAAGQGRGAVDTVLKLVKGEKVDQTVYIPFELVTKDNLSNYTKKN